MQLRGQVLTNCGKVSAGLAASQGCQASDLRATVSGAAAVGERTRVSQNIFGDLSILHGQFKNLKGTIQAQKALKVTNEWCNEYARRNGWGPPPLDFIAATTGKGPWHGAPTAEPATQVDMGTSMAVRPDDGTYLLEIADAILGARR
jgi:hypothetical protein